MDSSSIKWMMHSNKSDWRPRMSKSSEVHHVRGGSGSGGGRLRDLVGVYIQNLGLLLQSVSLFCL